MMGLIPDKDIFGIYESTQIKIDSIIRLLFENDYLPDNITEEKLTELYYDYIWISELYRFLYTP